MRSCSACGTVAPEGARFCASCGEALDERAPPDERKLATVLFADLVGSTARAEDEDPERIRALLDRFYDAMREEIELAGGTVEKFAGDAVMAAFGAPAAHEDHAERALHAGLAMQRRLRADFGRELALRIGVNTGEVVSGRPREGSSFVSGDAVNVAARLEQAASPGEMLVGERTAAAVRGAFELGEERAVPAKGKREPVPARPVVRALSLMRPRGAGALARVFVGRDVEIELLRATYRRAVHGGEPHLVTIMGEAGVGKTRLVRELWRLLSDETPEPLRRTGRCLPYGRGITYWAIGEMLREHYGLVEDESADVVLDALGEREILGLALGLDVSRDAHPLAARESLHGAVVDLLSELAAERPVVALAEDLHWADDELLDLLERMQREVAGPLLVIATARPELLDRRPEWGGGRRNASLVWLEALRPEDARSMLDALVPDALPDRLRALVAERAEGNPFFVEELVAALIDRGVLRRAGDGWEAGEDVDDVAVPDSVHAVLAARIDLLPPEAKDALQAASVVGRTFWLRPLARLLDGADPDLAVLEERDFILRRPGSSVSGDREWAIKHALTREVAYNSIPKARRLRLHASLAEWLEREGRPDELAPLLAHHFAEAVSADDADLAWHDHPDELARLREQAVRWLRRAAELALGRYELEQTVALLGRAAELEDDPHERAVLWRETGVVHAMRYDGEAFWATMHRALEAGVLDREEEAEVYSLLAFHTTLRSGMWRARPRRELVADWVERATSLTEPRTATRARAMIALSYSQPEHPEYAREAAELADRLGDARLRSHALTALANSAFESGDFRASAAYMERRLALAAEVDDPDHWCEAYENAAPVCVAVGRFDEARRITALYDDASRNLTPHHRVHAIALRTELAENLGAWDELASLSDDVWRAVDENLETPCVRHSRSLLLCGLGRVVAGDEERAQELFARSAELEGTGQEPILDPLRLRLALVRGDRAEAARLVDAPIARPFVWGPSVEAVRLDAMAMLRQGERLELHAPTLAQPGTYLEPFALRALGIVRGDDALVARAGALFAALGLDWHGAQTAALVA